MEVNLCFLFTGVRQDLFCMHAELSHVLMCGVIIYQASMMEQKQEKLGDNLVRYRVADFRYESKLLVHVFCSSNQRCCHV